MTTGLKPEVEGWYPIKYEEMIVLIQNEEIILTTLGDQMYWKPVEDKDEDVPV